MIRFRGYALFLLLMLVAGSLQAQSTPTTAYCEQRAGVTADLQIAAAIASLRNPQGGVVDCQGYRTNQTIASDVFSTVTRSILLRLGSGITYTFSASTTIPSNVFIVTGPGLTFSVAAGRTLTINTTILGPTPVFSGAGTVVYSPALGMAIGGLKIVAPIGALAASRTDAGIEIVNDSCYLGAPNCHALLSFVDRYNNEEAAISVQGTLSNGAVTQQEGWFTRYVNDINTFNNYQVVHGEHLVDNAGDKTPFLIFSNNSAQLLAGNTSALPWNNMGVANSLTVGTGATSSVMNVYATAHFVSIPVAQGLTTGKAMDIFYKTNGGSDQGILQSFDYGAGAFRPMDVAASIVRVKTAGNQAYTAPTGSAGIELYYRTDPGHGEATINSYDRDVSQFEPIEIAASISRIDGTLNISNAFTSGVGIEMYYRLDGAHDEGEIQSYSRTGGVFKPLSIDASTLNLNVNSLGSVVAGASVTAGATSTTTITTANVQFRGNSVLKDGTPTCSGGGCAVLVNSINSAGKVSTTTTGVADITVTFSSSFDHVPVCMADNITTGNLLRATQVAVGSFHLQGTTASGDNLGFVCIGN